MKKSAYFKVIVTVTVLVAFLLMNILAKIQVELGSDKIVVKGIFTQTEVEYDDIQEIELIGDLNYGTRLGISTFMIVSGTYTNKEFGTYKLMAYRNIDKHIIVKYNNKIMVFNQNSIESTGKLYQELVAQID
ncbi:MAG: PH domain-containing protein [Erysipelotrichaceae bacterium]|nr:PH domain-containing protein [Erysipelotrichaceae bacterium]MDD4642009.1 PH domain-containing protein [Erysipelotrichaceae bacterium]